ncbi:hypothetical protein MW290_24770 [Aquincola tertiaricarbonis]|uniref:Uncharacterized protein n=1 Tax=Aquincola tertiaricarbonis TaxID=391953 RepID=A0ABY4S726_AQUTE|nr:hypothetical protein [Aquincola tertiaricarbonis]URI08794.1 hypothetical protein MW290_24770 [Aquincola tertiaricarbonis]
MTDIELKSATVVHVFPMRVWVEADLLGAKHVVCQHEGESPFTYATFNYDWRYTSNAGVLDQAMKVARSLGAQDPIEVRDRALFPAVSQQEQGE